MVMTGDSEITGKIRYAGPDGQRIEQHHLAAGAEQADDQAVDHRARVAVEPPAGAASA